MGPNSSLPIPMGSSREERDRFFIEVDRGEQKEMIIKRNRVCSNCIYKKREKSLFIRRVIKHCNRLPIQPAKSPSCKISILGGFQDPMSQCLNSVFILQEAAIETSRCPFQTSRCLLEFLVCSNTTVVSMHLIFCAFTGNKIACK